MAREGRRDGAGYLMAGALVLLTLSLAACGGGGGSRVGAAGGAAQDPPIEGAAEDGTGQTSTDPGFDRMVVKTAELGIRAGDVRTSASEAREVSARFGGDILSSRVYGGEGPVSADLVFSVPSGEFEAALDALRGLGRRVTTDSVEGQDVTEEFVDLESRERNLLAAEESLLRLYDRAESVDDTLEVQRELTGVRGQIEEVQGRVRYLERRTAAARISLSVEPVPVAAGPQRAWKPTLVVARSWDASLRVLQAGATALLSAAVFCWWLTPVLVGGLAWWRHSRALRSADGSG